MKKNQDGFSALEGLLIVAAIVLVIGVGWFILNNRPKPLSVILDKIKTGTANSYNDVYVEQKKWTAQYNTNTPQKVDGYSYRLSPQSGTTITFERQDSPLQKTVTHFFVFKKTVGTGWAGSDVFAAPFAKNIDNVFKKNKFTAAKQGDNTVYKRANDTCLFSGAQLSCFSPELLRSLAAEAKPLVDAYLAKHPNSKAADVVAGPLTIKSQDGSGVISSSHAAGYDLAEVVITTKGGKIIALYYHKSGGEWQYVTEAGDEFGFKCGPMKADPEARKALYDQICLSETGQVKLDTNNRALQ